MKIAMVFDGLQTGGIERVGVDYARLFRELGHEVDAYNLRPALTAGSTMPSSPFPVMSTT